MPTPPKHDIFLSYSREDKERVKPIVKAIEKEGFTVWWDDNIPPGTTWRTFIQENLDASQVVVVIWSYTSIASNFVMDEAEEGRERDCLFPIFIDKVKAPLGLRSQQNIELINWQGEVNEVFDKFLDSIRSKLGHVAKPSRRKEKQMEQAWKKALKANTSAALYDFLDHNWHSNHAKEALKRAQELEKQEQSQAKLREESQQQSPFTLTPSANSNYWAQRLNTLQASASVQSQLNALSSTNDQEPDEEFIFYTSWAFWVALLGFPLLGLGGAWVAEQVVGWGAGFFAYEEAHFNISKWWLYFAGALWGVIYLIQGTTEASTFDNWVELPLAIWTPLEYLLVFDDTSFKGFITALPINLILSWGIAFAAYTYLGVSVLIPLGVLTFIQVGAYFRLDE